MKKKKDTRKQNKPFDFILCITIFLLLALGIIMVMSASAPSSSAMSAKSDSFIYLRKQLISAGIGVALMLILSAIDYKVYKKKFMWAYALSIIVLALVPIIGYSVNGAKRWIDLGFTSVQPSEIVKLLLIIFYAVILSENKEKIQTFSKGFLIPFALLVPILAQLIIFQSHLSATIVILMIVSVMMITAGTKIKHFILAGAIPIVAAIGALIVFEPYRLKRFTSFLDPWADKLRRRLAGDSVSLCHRLTAVFLEED